MRRSDNDPTIDASESNAIYCEFATSSSVFLNSIVLMTVARIKDLGVIFSSNLLFTPSSYVVRLQMLSTRGLSHINALYVRFYRFTLI